MADIQIHELPDGGAALDNDIVVLQRGTGDNSGFKMTVKALRQFVALKDHNPTVPYLAGMSATKSGRLYVAKVNVQGVFDPTKWREVAVTGNREIVSDEEQLTITAGGQHFIYGDQTINGSVANDGTMIIMEGILKGEGLLTGTGIIKEVSK